MFQKQQDEESMSSQSWEGYEGMSFHTTNVVKWYTPDSSLILTWLSSFYREFQIALNGFCSQELTSKSGTLKLTRRKFLCYYIPIGFSFNNLTSTSNWDTNQHTKNLVEFKIYNFDSRKDIWATRSENTFARVVSNNPHCIKQLTFTVISKQ